MGCRLLVVSGRRASSARTLLASLRGGASRSRGSRQVLVRELLYQARSLVVPLVPASLLLVSGRRGTAVWCWGVLLLLLLLQRLARGSHIGIVHEVSLVIDVLLGVHELLVALASVHRLRESRRRRRIGPTALGVVAIRLLLVVAKV